MRQGIYLSCLACQKEFYAPKYRIGTAKFCSMKCHNSDNYKHYAKVCQHCKKNFFVSNSRLKRKFCSEECYRESHMDEKQRRKRHKIYELARRGYGSSRRNKKIVFAFKPKRCENCGYNEYDFCLDIHHRDGKPTNNVLTNLVVLCSHCHRKLHKGIIQCPLSLERVPTL